MNNQILSQHRQGFLLSILLIFLVLSVFVSASVEEFNENCNSIVDWIVVNWIVSGGWCVGTGGGVVNDMAYSSDTDLSASDNVNLTFNWEQTNLEVTNDFFNVYTSSDGGSSWNLRWGWRNDGGSGSEVIKLPQGALSSTVRMNVTCFFDGMNVGDECKIDNIKLISWIDIPVVTLNTPPDFANWTIANEQSFDASFTDEGALKNTTLFIWDSDDNEEFTNDFTLSGTSDSAGFVYTLTSEGVYHWNYWVCDEAINCAWNDKNFTVTYQVVPNITFVSPTPANGSTQANTDIFVNLSTSDSSDHYTFADFDSDLVLWMRMDDTNSSGDPIDLSSKSNNGSLVGDAVINSSSGYWGNGSWFDGNNDYIDLGDTGIILNSSNEFSISAWYNLNFPKQTFFSAIVTQDYMQFGTPTPAMFGLGLSIGPNTGNKTRWRSYLTDTSTGINSSLQVLSTNKINMNQWYHAVGTYNKSTFCLYQDGVLQQCSAHSSSKIIKYDAEGTLRIGNNPDENENLQDFNGTIDEVLIFNRTLTATEISALYNATATQYANNFTSLATGEHIFTGYAVDLAGNKNQTEDRTVTISSDSCTYSSGNWILACSDSCSITSNVDLAGNNVSIQGTGKIDFFANITNIDVLAMDSTCTVNFHNGGRPTIII